MTNESGVTMMDVDAPRTDGNEKMRQGGRQNRNRRKRGKKPNDGNPNQDDGAPAKEKDQKKRVKRGGGSNVCFQFVKNGSCDRGESCKFSHDLPAEEMSTTTASVPACASKATVAAPTQESSSATKSVHITANKFADLQISAESRRAMKEVFKYEFMTQVQSETLPLILKGDDCLAKAKTGTGKTLGFLIPTIEKLKKIKHHEGDVGCLCISPTRELASQIASEAEILLTFHRNMKVVTCVGGTSMNKDLKALRGSVHIVVATPGRLLDHLQNNGLAQRMAKLDVLILDEADQLLDMGFRPDIERILRLLQLSVTSRQTLLFSATVPKSVTEIARIALRPKYNFVDTVGEESEQTHSHVKQEVMVAPQADQFRALASILARETSQQPYKVIVFFTTARLTGFMAELFNSVSDNTGFQVLEIHSRKSQPVRKRASDKFRDAKNAVLFTSDVSARGMDYPGVTFVLQIGLTDRAQYIHRLGRTARAGKGGKGALLLAPYEERHMVRKELGDMPLVPVAVPNINQDKIVTEALGNVSQNKELHVSAEQSYRAWLGYYNGALRKINWDKKDLVNAANDWAKSMGLKKQPSLQRKTIGKMGLKGVPGLIIE